MWEPNGLKGHSVLLVSSLPEFFFQKMTFADISYSIVCNNLFSKVRATPPFFEAVLPGQKAAVLLRILNIRSTYTANVHKQTTDKLMFKSVLSTVR